MGWVYNVTAGWTHYVGSNGQQSSVCRVKVLRVTGHEWVLVVVCVVMEPQTGALDFVDIRVSWVATRITTSISSSSVR